MCVCVWGGGGSGGAKVMTFYQNSAGQEFTATPHLFYYWILSIKSVNQDQPGGREGRGALNISHGSFHKSTFKPAWKNIDPNRITI